MYKPTALLFWSWYGTLFATPVSARTQASKDAFRLLFLERRRRRRMGKVLRRRIWSLRIMEHHKKKAIRAIQLALLWTEPKSCKLFRRRLISSVRSIKRSSNVTSKLSPSTKKMNPTNLTYLSHKYRRWWMKNTRSQEGGLIRITRMISDRMID